MSEVDNNDKSHSEQEDSFPIISSKASAKNLGINFETIPMVLGSKIGSYKLLSVLGEGGFGVVYLAEQERPIKRRVALKVIKPGMDTKQVIARFQAESQALALLDHPNIANIFDAGVTKEGRPYFVMEYVKGISITDYCDQQKLSIDERLELILQVCDAIQHAHQKGIIHRDIKPSNILVSIQDGKAVPIIIDFGVAKAINQSLTEQTLFTEQGEMIGTPEYMSPEQAEMTALEIDTRSDIYSLGVVIYELLTGSLPFETKTLREVGIDYIRQIIREQEPKKPSTRLSGLGDNAKDVADKRCTDIATLTKRLQVELEWIPLKAMRKECSRRYQSVSELSDDIRNYLNGEPLIAGPESIAYRIKKLLIKHRGAIVVILAVVFMACVSFALGRFMYLKDIDIDHNEIKIDKFELDRGFIAHQEQRDDEEPNIQIDWPVPPIYSEYLRDPMKLGSQQRIVVKSDGVEDMVVRGIAVSEDRKYAVVGTNYLQEGGIVTGTNIKVIKINPNSVEFEEDGKIWSQKVEGDIGRDKELNVWYIFHSEERKYVIIDMSTVKEGAIVPGTKIKVKKIYPNIVVFEEDGNIWSQQANTEKN